MSGMETPSCRLCAAPLTRSFVDLGAMPLANAYVDPADAAAPDKCYPLHARVCGSCFLVQVGDVVPPEEIFSDYAYFSSYSASWVEHARRYALSARDRLKLNSDSLVVEIASNDGYLLKHFMDMGIPTLGVEPAANVAREALRQGVPTKIAFFGDDTAGEIRAEHGPAELIVANNVLAHVPDLNGFVAGFATLLADGGVASFEFPHLMRLIRGVQFDTIYHEHFSYLSLYAVERCFDGHGLRVFDVEKLPTHGGSLRVWSCLMGADHEDRAGHDEVRAEEAEMGVSDPASYDGFAPRVAKIRDALLRFLETVRGEGKTVAAYGAAAKGNTLLNFTGVTSELISFVADVSPHKQGKLLPGSRIPVVPPDRIDDARPDYLLILPWNLRSEITASLQRIREWDGRFVVAVPELEIF